LLLRLGERLGLRFAGAGAALVWAIAPFSVTFAIGGLEISVYVLLLVGTVSAYINGRCRLAAFLAALSILTRPDALILIGPLAVDWVWQINRVPRPAISAVSSLAQQSTTYNLQSKIYNFQSALVFVLPGAAWAVFATLYFGSPIPHSITAKSVAYLLPPEAGLVRLLQHYGTPFMENLTLGTNWIGIGLVLYLFLYLVGGLQTWRASARIWPFLIYPWLYLIVFAAANPLIFRWYMTPPLPPYIFFILAGVETILIQATSVLARRKAGDIPGIAADVVANEERPRPGPGRPAQLLVAVIIIALPMALSLREWKLHPDHGLTRPAPDMAWYKLELLYRQAADSLLEDMRQRGKPDPTLAAGDVGVLGFFTGVRILDTVGLNSPQATRYYPLDPSLYTINYAIPPDLIMDEQPTYLVILEVYGRQGLLKEARFQRSYRLLEKLPSDIYGSDGLLIFVHRGPGESP
jgi:hypothetical protein